MPYAEPGKLTRQQNADVLAYILRSGRFPAGARELAARSEALRMIVFEPTRSKH